MDHLEDLGDIAYMKLQNIELMTQLRAANREKEERNTEMAALDAEIKNLRTSMSSLKAMANSEARSAFQDIVGARVDPILEYEEGRKGKIANILERKVRSKKSAVTYATNKEDRLNTMGSTEPAATAISLIDKRIRDLMMVRDKQIRTPRSARSTAVTDMMSKVVDGPATAAPRRTRGRMKKGLPTPPLLRKLVESGLSATEYDSGGYITVRRTSRRR